MTEVKRNPDGTVALPEEPQVRKGKQVVFYYKDDRANAPDAFNTQVVTYFPEEGDTVGQNADGIITFLLESVPRTTTLTVRPSWDYMVEYDIELKQQS